MTTEQHCQLCLHHRKWHVLGVCRWCGRMELRYPNANWMPGHEFVDDPEVGSADPKRGSRGAHERGYQKREAADRSRLIQGRGDRVDARF